MRKHLFGGRFMEVQLNEFTKVEVESRITIIRLNNEKKKQLQMLYLRNDKIIGAELAMRRKFTLYRFLIVLLLAVLAGLAHFLYDTQFLGYVANPTLISGLFMTVLIIGLFFCFAKAKYVKLLVESEGPNSILKVDRYSFKVGIEVEEKKLTDLLYILAI